MTLALGPGSYLALLERPGRAEARLPFLVPLSPPAGRTLDLGTVRLLEEGQVPPGFVYVPAGTSILGGDPEARSAGPRRKRTMAGFLLARFEVTVAEYREYLDLEGIPSYHHPAGLPGDLPAGSIRWADAHAYCQWSGRRTGLPCRLPMADEWERAARGADGRAFPWGEGFDGTFALTAAAGASVRLLPVGTYAADESPFGVRDLAGSLTEWCDLWYDLGLGLRPVRGGDFMDREPSIVRSASRAGDTGGALAPHRGLRVCLDLPAAD
ncbi:MAG: SUMF1/EgtB/PvdO family nonheme iron enzyme [Planctomycetes bacterium]|nr:SUMF1/EgtB/PvdO family nonheme iron enzyme [Planctomycetota bacterium]